ncbi:MAG: hypothetical protein J5993_04435 [Clostridia bacterium]|nr:hypothetical protein [Clostridia bacterium]
MSIDEIIGDKEVSEVIRKVNAEETVDGSELKEIAPIMKPEKLKESFEKIEKEVKESDGSRGR